MVNAGFLRASGKARAAACGCVFLQHGQPDQEAAVLHNRPGLRDLLANLIVALAVAVPLWRAVREVPHGGAVPGVEIGATGEVVPVKEMKVWRTRLRSRNGVTVVVPIISPYAHMRDAARAELPSFVEVYVKCSLEECVRRDPKGLYRRAGEIRCFTGRPLRGPPGGSGGHGGGGSGGLRGEDSSGDRRSGAATAGMG